MRELAVVKTNIAPDGLLQLVTALETLALHDIFDAAVEAFDHVVCLQLHQECETVLDAEIGSKLIELMLPRGGVLAQTVEPVGKDLGTLSQNAGHLHRGSGAAE